MKDMQGSKQESRQVHVSKQERKQESWPRKLPSK